MNTTNHVKLAYPLAEAADLMNVGESDLRGLFKTHKISTYSVGRRKFVPSFEIDRLMSALLSEEHQRRFRERPGD